MKFHGKIGFVGTFETSPGIWESTSVERNYYGDMSAYTIRMSEGTNKVNDDMNISNQLSIVADSWIKDKVYMIAYVVMYGAKWKVTSIQVQPPRLLLTVGGVYVENDDSGNSTDSSTETTKDM